MKRFYEEIFHQHFEKNRQILFLVGPRQVGKTTMSLELAGSRKEHFYLNYDDQFERTKSIHLGLVIG